MTGEPLYERVLSGFASGARLLDVGCGGGGLLAAAVYAGLTVSGVDIDPAGLQYASRMAPAADLRTGDAHELPFDDGSFDLVTLLQVLEHLPDPATALREAGRVAAAGGAVRASVWGSPDECDASVIGVSLAPLTGATPDRRRPPGADRVGDPDRLTELAGTAGLRVREIAVVRVPVDHDDADDLVAGVLASAPGRHAARAAGPGAVREALLAGLEPYRNGTGYRLVDTVRVLDAVPG